MTAVVEGVPGLRRTAEPEPRRLIGVGIRNVRADAAALRWAVQDARPGKDVVQIVHAYQPVDGQYFAGWDAVSAAVQHGSQHRASIAIIGRPAPGAPEQVLQEQSDEAVMLVIGDDEETSPQRRIAWHLQRTAHCPVVCVPRGADVPEGLPVTVVADDLGLSEETLDFAARYADRHRLGLQIARTWRALHRESAPQARTLSEEHAELDGQLTNFRNRHLGVAIVSRIQLDASWLRRVREHSSLVVVGRRTALRLDMMSPLTEPLCPVAFIPERWLNATT